MKKKIIVFFSLLSVILLVGCNTKDNSKEKNKQETEASDALMYTFTMEEHDYRFRMLDGWLKYPSKDDKIVFLVGNKEIKSFMTAGFEPKELSLDDYKNKFMNKLSENNSDILIEPEKKDLNGLASYYLSFTLKDAKERTLTYKTYLIETDDYFVNLAAWTSEESPSESTLSQLDKILGTFEQLK